MERRVLDVVNHLYVGGHLVESESCQATVGRPELGRGRVLLSRWDMAVLQESFSDRLRLPWASFGSSWGNQSRKCPRTHQQHVAFADEWAVDV